MKGLSQLACPFSFAFQRSMKGLVWLTCPLSFAFQRSVRNGHQAGLHGADQMSGSGLHPSKCDMPSISII